MDLNLKTLPQKYLLLAAGGFIAACSLVSSCILDKTLFAAALSVAMLKVSAILVLILVFVFGNWNNPYARTSRRLMLLALCCELSCDFSIEFSLEAGGYCSFLGMVFYALAFATYPPGKAGWKPWPRLPLAGSLAALAFAAIQLLSWKLSGTGFGSQTNILFLVYMTMIGLAAGFAFSCRVPTAYRLGILVFYLSDIIVYLLSVVGNLVPLVILNGILYYAAQMLFVSYSTIAASSRD